MKSAVMNDKTPTQKRGPQINEVTNLTEDMMRGRGNEIGYGKAVFLIGAGCSVSAGIPLGRDLAKLAARKLARFYSHGQQCAPEPEHALNWLKGHGYIRQEVTWEDSYGDIFKHFRSPQEQHEIVQQAINEGRGFINWAHLCLGELIRERYIHTVLTTNFDQLVLEGIVRTGNIPVVADGIESLTRIDSKPRYPQVVHLHGSLHTYKVRNSRSDVEEIATYAAMQRAIYQLLHDSNLLVVIGYAGGEEGVMLLLHEAMKMEPDNVIYWVSHSTNPDRLSDYAKRLLNGKNKFLILGQDADTFFAQLANNLRIGVPKWLRDPTTVLVEKAVRISRPENKDIIEVIGRYRRRLDSLLVCQSNEEADQKRLGKIRELRVAGRHSDALELLRTVSKNADAEIWYMLSDSAFESGQYAGDLALLHESIDASRRVLDLVRSDDNPSILFKAQKSMGDALFLIGARKRDTDKLNEAIRAYSVALEVATQEQASVNWARVQNNLGAVFRELGELTNDRRLFEQAREAHEAALSVFTRKGDPLSWAKTQNNLANVLLDLGRLGNQVWRLQEAEMLHRANLEVFTPERDPMNWAMTRDNLGIVLREIAERVGDKSRLEEAITSHRAALTVFTSETAASYWREGLANLGDALQAKGKLGRDIMVLEEAASAYRKGLEGLNQESGPEYKQIHAKLDEILASIDQLKTAPA